MIQEMVHGTQEENRFSIGEMSDICNVSKRTLRYYDVIGLIQPAYTNPDNGYRYYDPYQVGRVHLVKQMQDLGLSLDEIADCVKEKGEAVLIEEFFHCLGEREKEITKEQKLLRKQQKLIQEYLRRYEQTGNQLTQMDQKIRIEYFTRRYLVCKEFTGRLDRSMFGRTFAEIGSMLQSKNQTAYDLVPQIGSCFTGQRNTEACKNHVGFFLESELPDVPFSQQLIEEGFYACYRYRGEYKKLDEQYQMLGEYLVNMNYKKKDFCVEIYTVSPSINLNEKEYITELQVPIFLQNCD